VSAAADTDNVASRTFRSLLVALPISGAVAFAALTGPAGGTRRPVDRDGRPALKLRVHTLRPGVGLAAGDAIQRRLALRYGRRGHFARVILVTRARRTSRLDADRLGGLQLSIDRCSVAWTRRRGGPYRCAGRRWRVLGKAPAIGRRRLRRLSLAPGRVDHLRLSLVLPAGAGNGLQHQTSRLVYRLVGS
jgi:hypothetical protein